MITFATASATTRNTSRAAIQAFLLLDRDCASNSERRNRCNSSGDGTEASASTSRNRLQRRSILSSNCNWSCVTTSGSRIILTPFVWLFDLQSNATKRGGCRSNVRRPRIQGKKTSSADICVSLTYRALHPMKCIGSGLLSPSRECHASVPRARTRRRCYLIQLDVKQRNRASTGTIPVYD